MAHDHHARHVDPEAGEARTAAMRRVTLVGASFNFILTIAQIAGGLLTHSQAVVADGLHTLSDLLSDGVVLFATSRSSLKADEAHPYGHARIETLATVVVGLILVAAGASIGFDAGTRLFEPERLLSPEPLALSFAVLALAGKEWMYHYTVRVANKVRSNMLMANAWHHRSDALSSLVVLAGVGGSLAGLSYLDAVAAIAVAAMIVHMGGRLIVESVRELIDTGLEQGTIERIRKLIREVDGVRDLHLLRTRRMGGFSLADVHIQVNPRISVSEGHQISENVRRTLMRAIDGLADVTVHIDPENDLVAHPEALLPTRADIETRLRSAWADVAGSERVERIDIHYLRGQVELDLYLGPDPALAGEEAARQTAAALKDACRKLPEVGEVAVYFR